MEVLSMTPPSKRGPHPAFSVLRRSSVVLNNRRLSLSKEDLLNNSNDVPSSNLQRRFSTNPLTQSAPLVHASRRNSVATVRRQSRQHDLSPLEMRPFAVPLPPHAKGALDTIHDEDEDSMLDSISVVSDITDVVPDDMDPSDWFLEEDMDDDPVFTILEKDELVDMQSSLIESTATQLALDPADAALVLQHFNWDNEKLLREYFDDPEYHQAASGLAVGDTSVSVDALGETFTCPVCMEEKSSRDFRNLWCAHRYCVECWREYLHQMASSLGAEIVNVNCMYPRCTAKINFKNFEELADPYDAKRHNYFYLKHFTESDPRVVLCPNPSCGNAAQFHGTGRPTDVVECHCGTRFCFSCGHEKHNPVTCEQLNSWLGQLQDDGESIAVIKATSKPCFHCGVATTRVSGCNHMICRKEMGGCGGEWCWMCRGDWSTHGAHTGGFYSCNKYEQSEAKLEDDEARKYLEPEESRHRLLHYYNRYFNHDVLMKTVQRMLREKEVDKKMVSYTDITGCSPEFYCEAAELLVECRRVLKYTYVYGYYLHDGPGKVLFEYQQASAEGITERLSEMFHAPIEDIAAQPLDFVNYIRVTKKYISNLVHSIEEDGFVQEGVDPMTPPPHTTTLPPPPITTTATTIPTATTAAGTTTTAAGTIITAAGTTIPITTPQSAF